MNSAPLLLDHYFVTEIKLVAHSNYDTKKHHKYHIDNLRSDVKFLTNEKYPNVWQVPLTLKYIPQAGENVPYTFTINIIGFFEVDEKWPKAKIGSLVRINAPAILYSAAREIVASLSGRGPWGSVLLPSVNFIPKAALKRKRPMRRKRTSVDAGSK